MALPRPDIGCHHIGIGNYGALAIQDYSGQSCVGRLSECRQTSTHRQ